MNNKRRREIKNIVESLEVIKKIIEDLRDEEQDSLDNIPENLQDSINCFDSEFSLDCLDNSINKLNESIDQLKEV